MFSKAYSIATDFPSLTAPIDIGALLTECNHDDAVTIKVLRINKSDEYVTMFFEEDYTSEEDELDRIVDAFTGKINEDLKQHLKQLSLKTVENNFLAVCDILTQSSSHAKLGFAQLNAILDAWPDPTQKIDLSLKLLAIDAEAKREGGLEWWDDCFWHDDI